MHALQVCQYADVSCGSFTAGNQHGYLQVDVANTGCIPASYTVTVGCCSPAHASVNPAPSRQPLPLAAPPALSRSVQPALSAGIRHNMSSHRPNWGHLAGPRQAGQRHRYLAPARAVLSKLPSLQSGQPVKTPSLAQVASAPRPFVSLPAGVQLQRRHQRHPGAERHPGSPAGCSQGVRGVHDHHSCPAQQHLHCGPHQLHCEHPAQPAY